MRSTHIHNASQSQRFDPDKRHPNEKEAQRHPSKSDEQGHPNKGTPNHQMKPSLSFQIPSSATDDVRIAPHNGCEPFEQTVTPLAKPRPAQDLIWSETWNASARPRRLNVCEGSYERARDVPSLPPPQSQARERSLRARC